MQLHEHLLVWHGDEGVMDLIGEDDFWEVEEDDVQEVDEGGSKLFQHGIQSQGRHLFQLAIPGKISSGNC